MRKSEFHRDAYWISSYVQISNANGCANLYTERRLWLVYCCTSRYSVPEHSIITPYSVVQSRPFQAGYSKFKHSESYPFACLNRPFGLQEFESPRICRQSSNKGSKFVSPMHWPHLPSGNIPGTYFCCRSQWPRGLRHRSDAACLLRSWVRIPPGAWMSVCCECCVLSGRGLCVELITRPEESYRLWCVVVCDLETSWMRRPWPTGGCRAKNKQTNERTSLHLGICELLT